jgi:protein-L-isoaspartate(D-aspartate) O-methyltransferase
MLLCGMTEGRYRLCCNALITANDTRPDRLMDVADMPSPDMSLVQNPPIASGASGMAAARALMVDGQVRPNKVTDPRIIAAMRRIARERFVPPQAVPLAYSDEDVPLGGGRYLTEPMVIARLAQIAAVRADERVLVVAAGSGYGAALLAACGARVTALESDPALLALARAALADEAPGVTLVEGELAAGWAAGAPYDVILIDGAVEEIPQALIGQLRPAAGRLVTVRVAAGQAARTSGGSRISQAVIGELSHAGLSLQPVFDCAIPPAFRKAPKFVF